MTGCRRPRRRALAPLGTKCTVNLNNLVCPADLSPHAPHPHRRTKPRNAYHQSTPSVARDTPPAPTKKHDRARESRARATHPVDLGHRIPLQPPRHALRARANEQPPRAGSAHLFVGAERLRALDETAAARVRVLRAEPVRDARRRIEARTAVSGACAPAAAKHSKNAFACFAQPLGASGK